MLLYGSFLRAFDEVIDETVMEVNDSVKGTTEKLIDLSGPCRLDDGNQLSLCFYCNPRGRFSVSRPQGRRRAFVTNDNAYYVKGKVVSENGKTLVKIYSVKSRETMFWRWLSIITFLLLIPGVFLLKSHLSQPITARDLAILCLPLAWVLYCLFFIKKEEQHKQNDLDIMKEAAIQRVEAVIHWND